jgi:hypothetical protein
MFVDEVGNSDLESSSDPNHQFLSLTGIIVDLESYPTELEESFRALKIKHFGTDSIVFHRREMISAKAPFESLKRPFAKADFDRDLLRIMERLKYTVLTVVIDKKAHKELYTRWSFHPYHYCMTCLLERYVKWLVRHRFRGDVMAESRNRKDDEKLKNSYRNFYLRGSRFLKERRMLESLTTNELKLRKKDANINGLQMADLIAHPSFRHMLCEKMAQPMTAKFGIQIVDILNNGKYDDANTGQHWGHGKKWLPK